MSIKISFLTALHFAVAASFAQPVNIALHKPVYVSSEAAGFPAANLVDGKISRFSKWEAANAKAPHYVEIDLQQYFVISELRVHSGITDQEKKPDELSQAPGFWSIKNFRVQYWDDANWSDLPKTNVHENRETAARFSYNPGILTYKIRLVCDDGEPVNIMELEVFGTRAENMPAPPSFNSDVKKQAVNVLPQNAVIKVLSQSDGKSMKYVGYNQGYYYPGSNASGWVEYSQVNAFRVWASLKTFVPQTAVQVDEGLVSVEAFDERKRALRASPENNAFIKWQNLVPFYETLDSTETNAMVLKYSLSELRRLGVDVLLQVSSTDFDDSWSNKWKQWQRYYALAYYAAKEGDVSMFAFQNEPNHRLSGPMKLDQWITGMQIVSDAVHCAVQDVNSKYSKLLQPRFVGPVTAGQNTDWWSAITKAIRTDYHGHTLDQDLMEIFSTHSYNSPAVGYESRINNIRKIIQENHPKGNPLPIVYTEIGRWMNGYLIDKEETMDSPSLFTEWAGIYANNMKNGGYGMWAFKFSNTKSDLFSRGVKSGHHFTWQGKRIVEDAYRNLALGKTVTTSNAVRKTTFITDGLKTDASAWVSDSATAEKWVEIDLGSLQDIGSAVIYSGSSGGVYTSPDRINSFKLQSQTGGQWKDIAGAVEKNNKYAQVFFIFKKPVSASKIRWVSNEAGRLKIREIKLFAAGDGPSNTLDYNISGIQRTGEVVRLFAKGFKNERPLFKTSVSADDKGLDACTAYDSASGNYYMWLVQRGQFDYHLTLDLSGLEVAAGVPISVETVSQNHFGEMTHLVNLPASKTFNLTLSSQSVVLLTIPKQNLRRLAIHPVSEATITGGPTKPGNKGIEKELHVQLDASSPANNKVAYLRFEYSEQLLNAGRIFLKVNGRASSGKQPFRMHVYGIPGAQWNQQSIHWANAPLLDAREALIGEVGQKAFVAGEIGFVDRQEDHMLDVTDLVKKHGKVGLSFAFIRETRQLGDDEDKGRQVNIVSGKGAEKPELIFYTKQ